MSLFSGATLEAICDVDIEQTQQSFHAYAVPDGVSIGPGDRVLVHDAPANVGFGEHVTCRCRATVMRAGFLRRLWTRFSQLFELTELYEVGFQPIAESAIQPKYPAAASESGAPWSAPASLVRSVS